ncbi:nucleotide exchange factor GrpE [Sporosarcina trichiuri]|uniref:nucleotide exchange factor GrpE n=1 Tax=Sporosarcina trichiuri TaxID=3056445 RepID=UPI0025B5A33B|nr:nucleotide exchange factor GrpE [Sporosarcina sp. 0.2-SM1T-5]WJY28513.1 nucleotide exchange factor GrpE [Sporosarcina sp. 0.2-SM1T-5]
MTEKEPVSEEVENSSGAVNDTEEENAVQPDAENGTADQTDGAEADERDRRIADLENRLEEEENRRLRILADLDNTRRRANLDKEAMQKYRAQEVLTHLIPVLDNFERGLSVQAESEDAKSLMTGMQMVYRSLDDALKSEGLQEIEAAGLDFDPNFHQAVMTGTDEEKPSGIVLEVLQKGYMLKDRVLRPAMVKVNE